MEIQSVSENNNAQETVKKIRPKISVIIPVYNQEIFIRDCLDSLRRQTLQEWEAICIDDGSTDASLSILNEYASADHRIRVIHQENHGTGYSRNVGIKAAIGEFIAFLDPDDFLPANDVYIKLYNNAIRNEVSISGGSLWIINQNTGEITKEFDDADRKFMFTANGMVNYRDYQFDYGFTRFLYERNLLIKNNIFFREYSCFEDPPFFIQAMCAAEKFYAVTDCTYCYRKEHKKENFSEKKVFDLIRGVTDVLALSSEQNLQELHKLVLQQLCRDSSEIIRFGLETDIVKTIHLLDTAQNKVREEWLTDFPYKTTFDMLLNELKTKDKIINEIYHSASWKIGNMMIQPLHFIKKYLSKKHLLK